MTHFLLDTYARLLTTDTRACTNLFSADAEYLTRVGPLDLHFRGRDQIGGFLQHVPRQISFRAAHCVPDGREFQGALRLTAADLRTSHQHVRYSIESGQFKRFEVVSSI